MPDRNLTAEDVVSAIRTLDEAAGTDSNYFRWRLRLFLMNEAALAERRRLRPYLTAPGLARPRLG